jgi:hypothetical protein
MIITYNAKHQIYSFYSMKDRMGRAFNANGSRNRNMDALPWQRISLLDCPVAVIKAAQEWENNLPSSQFNAALLEASFSLK